jgi:hypothetical protein
VWEVPLPAAISWNPTSTHEERRSLQFFQEKTTTGATGWIDHEFWKASVLRLSISQPGLKHGLIAIGALHESRYAGTTYEEARLRAFSMHQYSRAISLIRSDHRLPLPVVLASCILFIALLSLQHDDAQFQTLKSGLVLVETLKSDKTTNVSEADRSFMLEYIEPILERHKTRLCGLVDLPYSLNLAMSSQFQVAALPQIPDSFVTIVEARDCLKRLLTWTCHIARITGPRVQLPVEVDKQSERWLNALAAFISNSKTGPYSSNSISFLKATHKMSFISIRTIGIQWETEFDDYVKEFADIVGLYRRIVKNEKPGCRDESSFGFDSRMIDTLSTVALRCRDPRIRREAIALLIESRRDEGARTAGVTALIARSVMEIAEFGTVSGILSCRDVPEPKRIRLHTISFFSKMRKVRLRYLRSPYDANLGIEEVWHADSINAPTTYSEPQGESDLLPTRVMGRGWAAFLEGESNNYYTITQPQYFFPIH